jgi:phosphatidylglycerophosphate synthase
MIDTTYQPSDRRPLASRDLKIAQRMASWLIDAGVSANIVSLSSIGFAALASLSLAATASTAAPRLMFIAAALFVQLRLLANLLDGMIAVASGRASREGELYNEVPDRVADTLILTGAGFAAGGLPVLGYLAALVAMFVTYVRALGRSIGVESLFIGPMAKPQRMAAITAASIYVAVAPGGWPGGVGHDVPGTMSVTLGVIVAGGLWTAGRRLHRIAAELRAVR